jgi:hypothetical protein
MAANRTKRKQRNESGSKLGEERNTEAPRVKVAPATPVTNPEMGAGAETIATEATAADKPQEPGTDLVSPEPSPVGFGSDATADDKPPAPKKPALPGVRPMRARPYLAGTIIAKHGLAAGVTDAMVAELDEAYGKPNPTERVLLEKCASRRARLPRYRRGRGKVGRCYGKTWLH